MIIPTLIEKEKIRQAKEILGDKNAEFISQIMCLQKYDERDKKALCCFHTENTPSLVYNPKSYSFHCFGCNRNLDIIDAYMHLNMTYVEAVKLLFDNANIAYPLGEHKVKDKPQYRYPVPPPDADPEQAYAYLEMRKISRETAKRAGIRQDEHGNIAFLYYDTNDVLKMIKYRPARKVEKGENKMWCQKGADTEPLLFNMHRVNVQEPLVICEGECDCLALMEAGITNVVSVPLGSQNTHWIEHNWEWLEQFQTIVLCGDNDEPGQKMINEITPRLGSWRVKIVELPSEYTKPDGTKLRLKDANDVLFRLGADALRNAVVQAKETPIEGVIDFADIQDVDWDEIDGIKIGIREFDKMFMRLFYGTFNIVSGTPGSGKTSFLYQLICNAIDDGVKCWVFSRELCNWLSRNWQMYILAGHKHIQKKETKYGESEFYVVPKPVKKRIGEYYRGMLTFSKDDALNDRESLLKKMTEVRCKYGARVFLIDNLMTVDLGGSSDDKYDRQTSFINDLITFASKYDACVILVAHPRKMLDSTADVDIYDISGSSNIINLAHRAIGLRRVSKAEAAGTPNKRGGWDKPPNPYSVMASVTKDRLTGNMGAVVGINYDKPSRRFFTSEAERTKSYTWDTASAPVEDDEIVLYDRALSGN